MLLLLNFNSLFLTSHTLAHSSVPPSPSPHCTRFIQFQSKHEQNTSIKMPICGSHNKCSKSNESCKCTYNNNNNFPRYSLALLLHFPAAPCFPCIPVCTTFATSRALTTISQAIDPHAAHQMQFPFPLSLCLSLCLSLAINCDIFYCMAP